MPSCLSNIAKDDSAKDGATNHGPRQGGIVEVTTALIAHPACLEHDTGNYHHETSERLRAVLAALEAEEFTPLLREMAPLATVDQLAWVHPRDIQGSEQRIPPTRDQLLAPQAGPCTTLTGA